MLTPRAQKYALLALALATPGVIALSCAPDLNVIGTGGTGGEGGTGATSSSSTGTHDAGHDAHDAGHDAADSGHDAADSGHDAADSGNDAESDASDSGSDAESDAGDAGDAADACMGSLTDNTNCGVCGHDCCGGTCMNGECQPFVVSSGTAPGLLAVDSTYVYWPDNMNAADGGILRALKSGGPPTALTPGQDHPAAVAVDANFVYWVTYSNSAPSYGGVFKAPIGGGTVIPIVASGEQWANDVVINGTNIYWDDYATNQIRRCGLDGTNLTTVAQMSNGVSSPLQMAIDPQFIYWSGRFGAAIQRAPVNGTGATNLATGTDAVSVAVDATSIYWANYQDGTIQKAPLSGGTAKTIASSGGAGPWSIAVDARFVYWADQGKPAGAGTDGGANGSIRVAPLNGTGAQGTVLAQSPDPKWIAIDSTCIYWSDNTTGNIGVVAKPP